MAALTLLIILGPFFVILGIFLFSRWNDLRKDPEALEAEKLLLNKGYIGSLRGRYLGGAIYTIIAGVGMTVAYFVLRAMFF